MGADVEQQLLAHAALPDLEVLVAGHHGSKSSTSEQLLAATVVTYLAAFLFGVALVIFKRGGRRTDRHRQYHSAV
jgi:hypothetical protein